MVVCGDANCPGGLLAQFTQRRQRGLNLFKLGTNSVKEAFACCRGGNLACGPGQQSKPEPFFEGPDGVAKRRLRNALLRSSLCKTPLTRDREES